MRAAFVVLAVLWGFNGICSVPLEPWADYPFRNTSLPYPERVKDLVGRLTLEEMVAQMSHGGANNNGPAPAIDRLGIKPYQWGTECLSGDVSAGPATSFPMAIGMAATFNTDILFQVSKATSDEVRSKNNNYTAHSDYNFHTGLSCWSPVINILRDPRWGRNQETYGECPFLSSALADVFVRGLQGDNPRYVEANAGCKHFDVHGGPENIPVSRFSFDSVVSTRDWYYTFLPAFKACKDAGTLSFMCSYNSINGVPACANAKLLTDITRTEWGFEGYVVSDQGAIENIMTAHHYTKTEVETAAAAINAGTCLEDANMEKNIFTYAVDAVNQGLIKMETIQDCNSRLFLTRMKLGEFDPPEMNPYTKLNPSDFIQSPAHRELSLNAALQSMVLLKNDGGFLPLTKKYSKIAVVGPFMNNPYSLFGDYSPSVMVEYVVTPLQGLSTAFGMKLANASGCDDEHCKKYSSDDIKRATSGADLVVVCLGTGRAVESEGNDRPDINFPGQQLQLLKDAVAASSNAPVVLVLYNAGPLDVSWAISNTNVKSIIESYFPAQTGGTALAKVMTGEYNPAGRLPNTWPKSLNDVPPITNYTMVGRTYRYSTAAPLYPFGYGLSYTTFSYSGLQVPGQISTKDDVSVKVTVENTGKAGGDEVVQVYLNWMNKTDVPQLQLVAVKRINIAMGQKAEVSLTVPNRWLSVLDKNNQWVVEPGTITVYVGGQQPNQTPAVPSNVLQVNVNINQ